MEYTVKNTKDTARKYKDKNGRNWQYLLPRQYAKLPKSEKRICGDMRKRDSGSLERILRMDTTDTSQVIGLYEYRTEKRWNETIKGYIPAYYGEEGHLCCVRIVDRSLVKSILFPLVLLGILAGLIMAYLWYEGRDEVPGLDETAVSYRIDGMVNTDPESTMIPMLSPIIVSASEGRAQNVLINPDGNGCYFIFSIVIDDTGEVVYESGLVEPGKAIVGFDLDTIPAPGTYDVTVQVETRDINDYEEELNGGDVKTTLTVNE